VASQRGQVGSAMKAADQIVNMLRQISFWRTFENGL
jgi:hypothetical protein